MAGKEIEIEAVKQMKIITRQLEAFTHQRVEDQPLLAELVRVPAFRTSRSSTSQRMMARSILLVGSIGASTDEADSIWTAAYHFTNDAHFRYLQLECDFDITDMVAVEGGLPRSVWDLTSRKSLVRVGLSNGLRIDVELKRPSDLKTTISFTKAPPILLQLTQLQYLPCQHHLHLFCRRPLESQLRHGRFGTPPKLSWQNNVVKAFASTVKRFMFGITDPHHTVNVVSTNPRKSKNKSLPLKVALFSMRSHLHNGGIPLGEASHSIGEAKEVFVKGIKQAPCKPLIKGFIQFMSTYGGSTEIPLLDSVIANAVIPGSGVSTALSLEDREDISLLFLKFVDLYGSVQELRKAWARHSKLFPHNTRNLSQRHCTTDCNKRRITEFLRVAHDCSPEGRITLKQSSKSETCSWQVDKEVGSQVDMDAVNSGGQGYDDEQNTGTVDAQQEVGDTAHGQHSLDKYGIQSQMFSHANQDISHDLTVCEQIDQTTICQASVSEKAAQAESCNHDSPSNSIADPKQIDVQDKIKAIELNAVDHHPGAVCSRSEPSSGTSLLKGSPSGPTPIFLELENKQLEKIQVKLETEHDVSVSNAKPESSSDNPEATQCGTEVSALSQDHIQSSQTQDLSVGAKPSSSEMATTQITTCSQFSPDNAVTAQAPLQHHMDNSQTYQSINPFLAGQNMQQMQQQGPAYAISQNVHTSPHSQVHLVAQPNQGNQQYMEMMQGYASQMWQYYQQQLYHLQTQHNQQIQSLQQQQLPTEHLQQSFTQQVQQLNQQMVLWQQQVQQQQQQQQHAQQVQQQSDKTQGEYHSGDTKGEQNKHQQQESGIDQSQQFQQQQQLLYFQQQQQMYFIQQQQQMYQQQQQQQQQLMQQQQYLSQMPQQKQDMEQQQELFQQQQQQLYDQQQKQMVVLQQQQQEFAQQQMQQYLQQQANQQVFKDQNGELNHQDARKRQLEHGQQSEASQPDISPISTFPNLDLGQDSQQRPS
ncbi:unnamed protein product [Triticum turgidum subsp. durum]|uniref:Uncharacterized protein n=1 Tax=Triticum turgidum subsp. durum TaxID=4567 RepID=A0A9R1NQZ9_TRITD|nr:unnamed protein product [Triticum turgidum subsp. durum]